MIDFPSVLSTHFVERIRNINWINHGVEIRYNVDYQM